MIITKLLYQVTVVIVAIFVVFFYILAYKVYNEYVLSWQSFVNRRRKEGEEEDFACGNLNIDYLNWFCRDYILLCLEFLRIFFSLFSV